MNFANPSALDGAGAWFINLADLTNNRHVIRIKRTVAINIQITDRLNACIQVQQIHNRLAQVGTSDYEKFLYVAQSTVSSGDPVNFAATLGTLGVPVLLQQVNGDTVVPNGDASLPLMGTDGLSSLVGAVQLTPGAQDVSGTPGIVKMTAGGHGSLLTPSGGAPQVTAELQTQAVSFILSGGAQTAVGSVAPGDVEIPAP